MTCTREKFLGKNSMSFVLILSILAYLGFFFDVKIKLAFIFFRRFLMPRLMIIC